MLRDAFMRSGDYEYMTLCDVIMSGVKMRVLISDCRESSARVEWQAGSVTSPHCALGTGKISDCKSASA